MNEANIITSSAILVIDAAKYLEKCDKVKAIEVSKQYKVLCEHTAFIGVGSYKKKQNTSLFGNAGLFGNTGGYQQTNFSLFGNTNNTGGSLFGNTNTGFGSVFGAPTNT